MKKESTMTRHTITVSVLDGFLDQQKTRWISVASSWAPGSNKFLDASYDGNYRVRDHGNLIYVGTDKIAAVNEYNAAT